MNILIKKNLSKIIIGAAITLSTSGAYLAYANNQKPESTVPAYQNVTETSTDLNSNQSEAIQPEVTTAPAPSVTAISSPVAVQSPIPTPNPDDKAALCEVMRAKVRADFNKDLIQFRAVEQLSLADQDAFSAEQLTARQQCGPSGECYREKLKEIAKKYLVIEQPTSTPNPEWRDLPEGVARDMVERQYCK